MRLLSSGRNRRARVSPRSLLDRSAFSPLEQLEKREVLALSGVTITQFPRIAYDVTGAETFNAAANAYDVLATPTSIRFSAVTAPVSILPMTAPDGHGDVQIHARIGADGSLLGGVSGDDFLLQGTIDANSNGIADPGETTGVLLTGEIYAFGYLDSGGPTDSFDFRFVPTGGALLASWPAGKDIGITMTSEHSDFVGLFDSDFSGGAKGTIAPINPPAVSSIAGNVYCDIDFSNSLTPGDLGHDGVAISLTGTNNAGQAVNLSTFTAPDGTYSFANLRPGTYAISQTDPAHTVDGATTLGTAGGVVVDSDNIGSISLGAGVNATDYNFGHICLGGISGAKFLDATGDGLSADDTPLSGATIYLDANNNGSLDSGEQFTTTASDGSYSFQDLYPGDYVVREVVPAGTYQTGPSAGLYSVTVGQDQQVSGRDFDNALFGSISGFKYNDRTGDGITPDDSPLAGVTVFIDSNENGSLDPGEPTTTTGPDGSFTFTGLRAGTYKIEEVVPGGFERTAPNPVGYYMASVTPGQNAAGNDFANTQLVSISGRKYQDLTANGITADDTGLAGVTIYIDSNNSGSLDGGEPTTTTAPDGSYSFTGLMPGTYVVREVVQSGWVGTAPASGSYSVTLNSGDNATNKDFANTQYGGISGTKYKDLTGNGLTSDDTPLAGTTIYIDLNNNGSLNAGEPFTTTAADGSYSFGNLLPGTYVIREISPAGYFRTAPAADSYVVTLVSGQNATGKNWANALGGRITGTKFLDVTGNGLSADDTGLSGTTIYIDANNNGRLDSGERSTVTGSDGTYTFDNLTGGTYTIREVVPAGMVRTFPALTDSYSVTVGLGQVSSGNNFANAEMCDLDEITGVSFDANGTCFFTDLRGNTHQSDIITVTFTIRAGSSPHPFTLVSYTAPDSYFDATHASQQEIYDIDTGVFGPGTYQLSVHIPDSYYQIDFICGAAIDHLGPANSNIFYSAQGRLISADNGGTTAPISNASTLSGSVWLDSDNDGLFDNNEAPIEGARITVSWVDHGVSKSVARFTDASGRYVVGNLKSGFVYKITETQPSGYADGRDSVGTLGGTLGSDYVSNISLGVNADGAGYNFAERPSSDTVGKNDTAAVSFWTSTAGQNLIKSLNGGSAAVQLGLWLGDRFPNLFGAGAGSFNLLGKTNSQIASTFISRANSSATNLEAQVFATALSVYVTNSAWAGGTMAAAYGFTVNLAGSGYSLYNDGSTGTLLGLANNTMQTLLANLAAADAHASNGMIYNGNSSARTTLYNYFRSINGLGQIS
jgi:protocatechuate 3,4-dioxygenase beta subunit